MTLLILQSSNYNISATLGSVLIIFFSIIMNCSFLLPCMPGICVWLLHNIHNLWVVCIPFIIFELCLGQLFGSSLVLSYIALKIYQVRSQLSLWVIILTTFTKLSDSSIQWLANHEVSSLLKKIRPCGSTGYCSLYCIRWFSFCPRLFSHSMIN